MLSNKTTFIQIIDRTFIQIIDRTLRLHNLKIIAKIILPFSTYDDE